MHRILIAQDGTKTPVRHWTYEECEARYPRLLRAMRWVAILSRGEASCALRDWKNRATYGFADSERFGSEAVCHFGGARRVIREAIRVRHTVRILCKLEG